MVTSWTEISRYSETVGPREWKYGDWDKEIAKTGCLLRLAAVEESRLLMELMTFPLELAEVLLESGPFKHTDTARNVFASRTIRNAEVKRGKRILIDPRWRLWMRMSKSSKWCVKLLPVTFFKARSKDRKHYREWLAMEELDS